MEVSSQGWYMPRVTQLIRITVIVSRSNQLEWRRVSSEGILGTNELAELDDTHGLRRILMQSLRTG